MTDADEIVAQTLEEVADAWPVEDEFHQSLIVKIASLRAPKTPLPAGPGLGLYRKGGQMTTPGGTVLPWHEYERDTEAEAVVQAARKWAQIKADFDEFDGDRRSIAEHLHEAKEELAAAVSALDARLAKQGGRDDG